MKLKISSNEWKNARSYFKRHPKNHKKKKISLNTHSFIKVGKMIYALARKKDPEEGYLGKGAQGITVLGQSQKGSQVTVKIEPDDPIQTVEYFAILKKLGLFKGRFIRNFATVKQLLNRQTQSKSYTVLKHAEGQCLFDFLKNNNINSSQYFYSKIQEYIIALQATVALSKLHAQNIIHRDVKPENMIVLVKGDKLQDVHLKYIDYNFSIVIAPNQTEIKTSTAPGTKRYAAPEILEDRRYSFKSDIYALGKMFKLYFPHLQYLALGMCDPLPQLRTPLSDIISYLSANICFLEKEQALLELNQAKNKNLDGIDFDKINDQNLPYLVSWEALMVKEQHDDVPEEHAKIPNGYLTR